MGAALVVLALHLAVSVSAEDACAAGEACSGLVHRKRIRDLDGLVIHGVKFGYVSMCVLSFLFHLLVYYCIPTKLWLVPGV